MGRDFLIRPPHFSPMENPTTKLIRRHGQEAVINAADFDPATDTEVKTNDPPPKKKRGRPRKKGE